jgi:hypothetical protein
VCAYGKVKRSGGGGHEVGAYGSIERSRGGRQEEGHRMFMKSLDCGQ